MQVSCNICRAHELTISVGEDIPMILPACKEAFESTEEDESSIKSRIDHFWEIRALIPRDIERRNKAAAEVPPAFFPSYMMRTGIFDPSVRPICNMPVHNGANPGMNSKGQYFFCTWDQDTIAHLSRIVQQIEDSEVYNSKGFKLLHGMTALPGCGTQGICSWIILRPSWASCLRIVCIE